MSDSSDNLTIPNHDPPPVVVVWRAPAILKQAAVFLLFFAVIAPTLHWLEFSGGMENITVATSMETARDGHWAAPTFGGQMRIKKPPLAHWMGAVGVMSSSELGWGARWPTLVCACLMLLGTYQLAEVVLGRGQGLGAALICGSSYLFLKYARQATYDMPLAAWVVWANVFWARLLIRREFWTGAIGAAICLALGMMTKGPVGLLQSVVPVGVYLIALAIAKKRSQADLESPPAPPTEPHTALPWVWPAIIGLLVFLALSLPWYAYIATRVPGVLQAWMGQTTLKTERLTERNAPFYGYLLHAPYFLPWLPWFVIGAATLVVQHPWRKRREIWLLLAWVVVPIAIMSLVAAKRHRYLLPMLGPASVLTAWGIAVHLASLAKGKALDRALVWAHWALVVLLAAALALAGSIGPGLAQRWRAFESLSEMQTAAGLPWYTPMQAGAFIAAALVMVLVFALLHRRWRGAMVTGTVCVMLMLQAMYVWGYRGSTNGLSPGRVLADRLNANWPAAQVYSAHPEERDPPLDVPIYLGKTVRKVKSAADIAPAIGQDQVVLIPGEKDKRPALGNDWQEAGWADFDDTRWWAFVRRP